MKVSTRFLEVLRLPQAGCRWRTKWLCCGPAIVALLMVFFFPHASAAQELINRRDQARQDFLASPIGIYLHYCAHCHGDDGKGEGRLWSTELSPKPADLSAFRADKETLLKVIRDGSPAVGKSNLCPPWSRTIPPDKIERLAQYLLTLSGESSAPVENPSASQQDFDEPFPWLLAAVIVLQIGILGSMRARNRRSAIGGATNRI